MSQSINTIDFVLSASQRLLGSEENQFKLRSLPISASHQAQTGWQHVVLPDWAKDITPEGHQGIFVPQWEENDWSTYDWWRAAYE